MTLQSIAGGGFYLPAALQHNGAPGLNSLLLMDAATEKCAFVGRVWNKDGTTKSIDGVGFRFGAITKGATSDIQVSLQDVLLTSPDPDGVVDQSGLVGNANIVANTWTLVSLGASRSVTFGEYIAVVFEPSTFNGGDSFVISQVASVASGASMQSMSRLFTGAWALSAHYPNLILRFTDGTWGTLMFSACWSAINTHVINTGTTPDEIMMAFQFPFPFSTNGCWVHVAGVGDFDVLLLDNAGNTIANGSRAIDKDHDDANIRVFWTPWAANVPGLLANTEYFVSVRPSTATSVSVYSWDVATAAYMDSQDGGQTFVYGERTNGGAISKTLTRRPFMGIRVSGCDDGTGGGSGGGRLIGPGGLIP